MHKIEFPLQTTPGVDRAINTLIEEHELESVIESLARIFNGFMHSDDLAWIEKTDRSAISWDYNAVMALLYSLKEIKPGIMANLQVTEREAA